METIAARDEGAVQPLLDAVLAVGNERTSGVEVVQRHVGRLVDRTAAVRSARVHQVVRHLGLAVDGHPFPARQIRKIETVAPPAESHLDAVVP